MRYLLFILLVLGFSAAHADSLVGYWSFDAASLEDSSGNGLQGEAPLLVSYSDDVPPSLGRGKSIVFDGSNRVIIPHSPAFDRGDGLSISFWMKADVDAQADEYPTLMAKFSGFEAPGWRISKHGESAVRWDGSRPVAAFDGEWHHVVFVYDGKTITAYRDAVPVGPNNSDRHAEVPYDAETQNSSELVLGAREAGRHIRPYVGQLDEVAIFSRALTREEVEELYGGKSPKQIP